jgi:hypothetical protein
MASVRKRRDDKAVERAPVPPYPEETSGTWQAFRVTVHEDDSGDAPKTDKSPTPPAREDADQN